MQSVTRPKKSLVGIELIRHLAASGDRIFSTNRAREVAPNVGLNDAYLSEALHHLRRSGWIVPLRRGLHALSSAVPGVAPVHEFEIADALVSPAAISHWSALHHHGLTNQVPRDVYVLTTTEASIPRTRTAEAKPPRAGYVIGDTTYRFVQVQPSRFFGTEQTWVGDARVALTTVERSLLDGLARPHYCGDIFEVIDAFRASLDRLDIDRVVRYALRLDDAIAKRLGWVLEHHGVRTPAIDRLAARSIRGYRLLDPTGPRRGRCNRRWMIQENQSSPLGP